jgi:AcrR family transcriptional regulator
MSRWSPDAAVRLERAALELFAERGYAATTVPEITARAGLTTRTFFRHFADKREVLFLREREFPTVVSTLLGTAPDGLSPLDLVMHGLHAVASADFPAWREDIALRRSIVRADERLRERELLKSTALAEAIREALIAHGVEAEDAALAATLGTLVFDDAVTRWLDGPATTDLVAVLEETRAAVRRIAC